MYKEIFNTIKKYNKITIFRHEFADPDALGSQFGLKQLIQDNFSDKEVFAVGQNVKSLNGTIFPTMDEVSDEFIKDSLVIVLDTANVMRIDDKRYKNGRLIIKIDHHPILEQYGDYNYVDVKMCATSFFIMKFAMTMSLKVSPTAATYLYAGIIGDTNRFLHDNTDVETFEMAAQLLREGADIQRVYNLMYSRNVNEVKLTGHILDNFKMCGNHIAYYILEEEDYLNVGVDFERAKDYVNTLANIEDIEIWVSATYNPTTEFYHISIRSKNIQINDVAQQFGGGGHKFASGIKVSTLERFMSVLECLNQKV